MARPRKSRINYINCRYGSDVVLSLTVTCLLEPSARRRELNSPFFEELTSAGQERWCRPYSGACSRESLMTERDCLENPSSQSVQTSTTTSFLPNILLKSMRRLETSADLMPFSVALAAAPGSESQEQHAN